MEPYEGSKSLFHKLFNTFVENEPGRAREILEMNLEKRPTACF
jgi:hypothetical protein